MTSALCRAPTSAELLRAVALARGWVVGNGLPDEARAGRLLLKDYTFGKLIYCEQPPNTQEDVEAEDSHIEDEHHGGSQGTSYDSSEGRASSQLKLSAAGSHLCQSGMYRFPRDVQLILLGRCRTSILLRLGAV